ncbi:MAG: asparagine synthase (glutamine-hydrolyzing) [Elusimicrobia bacterium RIFOXYA2_FULL_50_26]|nr:MAG: asparagine synthase (glutamine-hydrolyzing) [Elusimicrobia bacterium RIFOXYA2_FULL_50_26]OGS24294.1 MAG: asparagine synthase (glutamine-hydrolyzing) [Elusimicrobia bacterium RIFOXYB2_FULL_50_12]
MCGICGVYHPGNPLNSWDEITRRIASDLNHRGPDEDGFYFNSDISLGMRRLKVIDMKTGVQPIKNETGDVVVIYNGEIYGFESIKKDLQNKGHLFKTQSDTEVIVHLYEEYGLDFFQYFDGMFAFALWDLKNSRLIVARDRFGIKPLFYTLPDTNGNFIFSSELSPMLNVPGLNRELDPLAVDAYLMLSYIPHPYSIYRGVKKLSPGSYLLAENNQVQEVSYWDLPKETEHVHYKQALEELDVAISNSVRKMMRSDVPVGAFLSGGLDSSTVVYYMTKNTPKPVCTFSVRFKEDFFDEGLQARATAKKLGTEHYEIWGKSSDIEILPELLAHFGEPFADPSQIPTYLVSKLARENVTVALSGDGGDEVLGGYITYCASMLTQYARVMPDCLRKMMMWVSGKFPVSLKHVGFDYKIRKFLPGIYLSPLEHHLLWRTIFCSEQRKNLYTADFAGALGENISNAMANRWKNIFSDYKAYDKLTPYQFLDFKTYLVDNNLTKVDRMSMANSLEVRIPLLDMEVFNAAMRLPTHARIRGLNTKVALREIMKGRLPAEVIKMGKKGFAVPLSCWFKDSLKTYVFDTLSHSRINRTGILSYSYVDSIIKMHMGGKINFSRQIWNLICFVLWHERNHR